MLHCAVWNKCARKTSARARPLLPLVRRPRVRLRGGLLLVRTRRRRNVRLRQLLNYSLLYGRLPRAGRLLAEEGVPLLFRPVEDVAVDVAVDPGRLPVGLILPERPGARSVLDRGMVFRGPDPDRIVGEGAARQDSLVEVHRRVDDRPLAVVALHFLSITLMPAAALSCVR